MLLIGKIIFFGVGFFQLFAIVEGLAYATDIPFAIAFVLAFVTTWIPLLGSILGIYGASVVWGWDLMPA